MYRRIHDFGMQNEQIQGIYSDFRYVEEFSGQSVKFRQNLVSAQIGTKIAKKKMMLFEQLQKNTKNS